ncbi:Zonular occludens toxin (Zot) [Pseudobythopirellula maris]|uniref:Zonular occludens toxin (Zot) n=1 Tax=Pseudobythopirellula maris TaxID=2527991 RepID=A0A5C5ZJZ7_9BACT|nr:zonular occludens toxin domain-containing protein [Pseudobythopirellula maris]TWT86783.1 Zonular occludens toxin (Zot) [Pseudobythopirellula maris]
MLKDTHQSFSISFVCGPPGSGKSYITAQDILARLVGSGGPKIITNLPLEVDVIADECERRTGRPAEEFRNRIILLAPYDLGAWEDQSTGPWSLVEKNLADGNDFILDECHRFCRRDTSKTHVRWTKWLGECRHEGWRRLVFVTQDESKVGKPISVHSELRYELTNAERRRDPILRIPMLYWYELIASFTREYRAKVAITEYRRVKGKLAEQHVETIPLEPDGFKLYRSYEAAGGGTGKGAAGSKVERQFEQRPALLPTKLDGVTTWPVWSWFLWSHWHKLALAGALTATVGWVTLGGGMNILLKTWISRLSAVAGANRNSDATETVKPPEPGELPSVVRHDDPFTRESKRNFNEAARPTADELAAAISAMPEPERSVMLEEMRHMQKDFLEQTRETKKLREQAEKLSKRETIVAIDGDTVWFKGGASYKEGDEIYEGPFEGEKVVRVNRQCRCVHLSNGVRLTVGVGRAGLSDASAGNADEAFSAEQPTEVPQRLPTVAPNRGQPKGDGSAKEARHDLGGRDGLRSVLQAAGR